MSKHGVTNCERSSTKIPVANPLFKNVVPESLNQIIFILTDSNNKRFGTKHDLYWVLTLLYSKIKVQFQNEMTQLEKLGDDYSVIENNRRNYEGLQIQNVLKDVQTEDDIEMEINERIDFLKSHIPPHVLNRIKDLAAEYNNQQTAIQLANGNTATLNVLNSKQGETLTELDLFMSSEPFFLNSNGRPKSDFSNFKLQLTSMTHEISLVRALALDFIDANVRGDLLYEISILTEALSILENR